MKKAIAFLLLTAAALAAQASGGSGATSPKVSRKTTSASKTTVPPPITIPKDAVANGDGTFSWTDSQGQKWNYLNTPFGVMKSPAAATPPAPAALVGVKAFDEGDKVRFERPWPFGVTKWEKNKTDLTDEERELVNKQAASQNAKQE